MQLCEAKHHKEFISSNQQKDIFKIIWGLKMCWYSTPRNTKTNQPNNKLKLFQRQHQKEKTIKLKKPLQQL